MTDDEALGAIGRLEAERRSWEQQNAALRHISGVIQRGKEAIRRLAEMEPVRAALGAEIASLQSRLNEGVALNEKRLRQEREAADVEIASCNEKTRGAQERLKQVEADLKEKEKFAKARAAQLDAEIRGKVVELEKVSGEYEAFRRKHGLA